MSQNQACELPVFHFILTCQWIDVRGRGVATRTLSGLFHTEPGQTRDVVYGQIRRDATELHSVPVEATTLFFALERNDLGGGAR